MLKPILISALILSAGLSGAAQAQSGELTRAVPVAYGDLDLQTVQGIERLDRRLNKAIERVCSEDMMVYPEARKVIRHCIQSKQAEVATLRTRVLTAAGVQQAAYLAGR